MKEIYVLTDQDFNPDAPVGDTSAFTLRQAARAVVITPTGHVPLLRVGKHNYHKLPGGGVDEGEDIKQALERELMEEIGSKAEVTNEIGIITEFRGKWELHQISYCFLAKQIGESIDPDFTKEEIEDDFRMVTMENIDEAIRTLESDQPTNYEGKFIQKRDLAILKEAKIMVSAR